MTKLHLPFGWRSTGELEPYELSVKIAFFPGRSQSQLSHGQPNGHFSYERVLKNFQSDPLTWHGHSACSSLKAETQADSQLISSLQSKTHCPRFLLVLVKQTSRLSSFESSFKMNNFHFAYSLKIPTYVTEADRVAASLAAINAISMTWACFKLNHFLSKRLERVLSEYYLQSLQVAQARLHSKRHSVDPQADTHCKYSSSHFEMHAKLKS